MIFQNAIKFSTSILYADDTTIYVIGRNLRFMKLKLQQDLFLLSRWLSVNHLKLNVAKTKLMLFNRDGLSPSVDIYLEDEHIENVESFKFLGVLLDNQLLFIEHFCTVYDKLQKSCFIIRSLCKTLPNSSMRQLYFAYYEHI